MPGYDSSSASGNNFASPPGVTQPSPEHIRLAGYKPLKTLLRLSVGPVPALIVSALYSIIDTIWISRTVGKKGMAAVSTYNCFDNIGRSFGMGVAASGAAMVSSLFGKGKHQEASQVVTDMFRCCVVLGIAIPLILNWALIPCARWFGASQEIAEMGYVYMLPILIFTFPVTLFLGAGGCIQGEGRSALYGTISIITLVINAGVLDPLFLLVFKWGLLGASLAHVLSNTAAAIILIVMYYCGKFGVKPKFSQLFKPFSPFTWPALKIGVSQAIAYLSQVIPAIALRKFLGLSCSSDEMYNNALSGFNCQLRYTPFVNAVLMAICQAYVPPAAYAFSAKMYRRWLWLTFHASWINFIWSTFVSTLCWTVPDYLSMVFSKESGYLKMAAPMLTAANAVGVVAWFRFNSQSVLQSMGKGTMATLLSLFCQFISLIGFSFLLYYTNKHDPVRLNWAFSYSHVFAFAVSFFFLIKPFRDVFKARKSGDCVEKIALVEDDQPVRSDYAQIA